MADSLAKQYKALLEAPEILIMPGVFDGFSAAIVEKMGFKAGFISGAGISESALGLSDVGVMGLEDNLARARALADVSTIPMQADADTGYGNAVNVYHTVRAFEKAGLSGVMIEDQVWPKRCGHMKGGGRCQGRFRFRHHVAHRYICRAWVGRCRRAAERFRGGGR